MLQRILVPLDGSDLAERALPVAFTLAERGNGEIILLRVPVPTRIPVPAIDRFRMLEEIKEDRLAVCRSYLKYVKRSHLDWPVPVQMKVAPGDASGVILDTAENENVGLIVMSTHGRSGLSRWLLGSVTERVLRHARCPVMAVRSETIPSRILIPLDGSIIAGRSLKPGLEVAQRLGAQVTLLRVVSSEAEWDKVAHAELTLEENVQPERFSEHGHQEALQTYRQGAAKECVPGVLTAVAVGRAAEGILDYAEAHDIDLIVMTTHGLTGMERWEYGSVTEKVMRNAGCSMLVMRAVFS